MTDKPIKEHYEVDSDTGVMVRTFDYIADLEKYCTSIEKDLLTKIATVQMLEKNFVEYMKSFEAHRDELQAQLSSKEQELKTVLEEIIEERKRHEDEFYSLRAENERLNIKLNAAESSNSSFILEIESLRKQLEEERISKRDLLSVRNKAINERDEYRDVLNQLRKRCEDLEAENKNLRTAIDALDKRRVQIRTEGNEKIEQLTAELNKAKEENAELRREPQKVS